MKVKDIKAAQEAGTLLLLCQDQTWMDYIRGKKVQVIDATLSHWYRRKVDNAWTQSDYAIGSASLYSAVRTKRGVLVQEVGADGSLIGAPFVATLASLRGTFAECRTEQEKFTALRQKHQDEKAEADQARSAARLRLQNEYGVKFYVQGGQVVIDPLALIVILDNIAGR